jgi:hypothetical protein
MNCSTPGRKTPGDHKHMAHLAQLQNQFSKNSEDILETCRTVMRHVSVTTAIETAVDVCILTERASAQSISGSRLCLVPHGFNMKICGFTVQSDKVEAVLPALQENWAEVKRSILQSETAVITAVAQQMQGAARHNRICWCFPCCHNLTEQPYTHDAWPNFASAAGWICCRQCAYTYNKCMQQTGNIKVQDSYWTIMPCEMLARFG